MIKMSNPVLLTMVGGPLLVVVMWHKWLVLWVSFEHEMKIELAIRMISNNF